MPPEREITVVVVAPLDLDTITSCISDAAKPSRGFKPRFGFVCVRRQPIYSRAVLQEVHTDTREGENPLPDITGASCGANRMYESHREAHVSRT